MDRPCLTCGEPSDATRCTDCTQSTEHTLTREQRGYDSRWRRLSRRARRLQPFCTDCGTTQDLTGDHSPEAWARHERGQAIRLQDIDVVCRSCNGRRGAVRTNQGGRGTLRGRATAARRLHLGTVLIPRVVVTSEGGA